MSSSGGTGFPDFGSSSSGGSGPYGPSSEDRGSSAGYQDPYAVPASYQQPPHDPYSSGYAPAYRPAPPTSNTALTGFILGLIAMAGCSITAPVGLVFSILGMKATAPGASPELSGRGFAIAGLVLSILGTLGLLLLVAYFVLIIGVGVTSSY